MAVILRLVVGVVATAPVSPWTLMVFLSLEAPDEGVSHGGSLSTCSSCCSTCSPTELIAAARGFLKGKAAFGWLAGGTVGTVPTRIAVLYVPESIQLADAIVSAATVSHHITKHY